MMSGAFEIDSTQVRFFRDHGYLLIDNFIDPALVNAAVNRFPLLFRGYFETTTPPDEWRWAEGRDPNDVTRMIWNGWKSDRAIARVALSEKVGFYCAQLAGWTGTRLNQDGCIWKPPGASGLAFHQDIQYINWVVPTDMITCWISLDGADETSGTLEYAHDSHLWPLMESRPDDFHSPVDHQKWVKMIAKEFQQELNIYSVNLPPGGAAFHHCRLWHGSGPNLSAKHRSALALHCMPDIAEFHPTNPAFAQGRFRKFNSNVMDEDFYPILWSKRYQRSAFIDSYLSPSVDHNHYKSHSFIRKA